jgi:hypothetical protein
MGPLAAALLHSVRYSHGRSLHPYEDTIAAVHQLWPLIPEHDRAYWLALAEEQVPPELRRMMACCDRGSFMPVRRSELEQELADYERLFAWCRARMGPVKGWPG